jgi:hypothetical protein
MGEVIDVAGRLEVADRFALNGCSCAAYNQQDQQRFPPLWHCEIVQDGMASPFDAGQHSGKWEHQCSRFSGLWLNACAPGGTLLRRIWYVSSVILFLLILYFTGFSSVAKPAADLIITNAKIWTVDQSVPTAQAVAVIRDRIVAVGSAGEINAWRGPQTNVIDAGGRLVLPGLMTPMCTSCQAACNWTMSN